MSVHKRIASFTIVIVGIFAAALQADIRLQQWYGQTFVVFPRGPNSTDSFSVYRSESEINSGNYSGALKVATLPWDCYWGISCASKYSSKALTNYVIDSLGEPIAFDSGVFAWTTKDGGSRYYAVVRVGSGETFLGAASATEEVNETIVPIWVDARIENGEFRAITALQYNDISIWNPCWQGYAYTYQILMPSDYYLNGLPDAIKKYRFSFQLHGLSAGNGYNNLGSVSGAGYYQLKPVDDCGDSRSTWHYGFGRKNRANRASYGGMETVSPGDTIFNYTQYRYLKMLDYFFSNIHLIAPDSNNIYCKGESMGGTGTAQMLFHYPECFAGGFNSIGITNWIAVGDSGSMGYRDGDGRRNWGPYTEGNQFPWVDLYRREKGDTAISEYWHGSNIWKRISLNDYWIDSVYRPNFNEKKHALWYQGKHNSNDMNVGWPENGYPFNIENSPLWEGKLHHLEMNEAGGHNSGDGVGPVHTGDFPKNKVIFAMHNATVDEVQASRFERFVHGGLNHRVRWAFGEVVDNTDSLYVPITYTPVMYPYEFDARPDITKFVEYSGRVQQRPYLGFPDVFTVDITPRRVQNFPIVTGQQYHWYRNGMEMGVVTAEASSPGSTVGIVTIPNFCFHEGVVGGWGSASRNTLTIKAGSGTVPNDITAPGVIHDLELIAVYDTTELYGKGLRDSNKSLVGVLIRDISRIALRFTAPGDDGATGRCTRYVLRIAQQEAAVATSPTIVRRLPAPLAAGEMVECTFSASFLAAGSYYMAVQPYDENNNTSGISNAVNATIRFDTANIYVDTGSVDSLLAAYNLNTLAMLTEPEIEELALRIYPDPFNPATTITVSGIDYPASGRDKIEIFNVTGALIQEFPVCRMARSGGIHVKWNAEGNASGVYLIRATIGDRVLTKRVILLQ